MSCSSAGPRVPAVWMLKLSTTGAPVADGDLAFDEEPLVALTPLYPAPLLPILDQWGFAYRVRDADAGSACIAICHVADRHALEPPQAA